MSDLIDRAKALHALVTIDTTRYCVPCKEVLKAIRELPSVEPNVHELQKDADCISRQATIDYFVETIPCDSYGYEIEDKDELRKIWADIINKIPTAYPHLVNESQGLVKDLVNKDYALRSIEQYIDKFDCIDSNFLDGLKTAMELIKELPSAEPQIIHCRDCKNLEIDSIFHDCWCNGHKVWLDHYCGYAERRTDGEVADGND